MFTHLAPAWTKQTVALLEGREDLLCYRRALRSSPPPPNPLCVCMRVCVCACVFFLKTFARFFHPHAWLQAMGEVKWKRIKAFDFKSTIPLGRDGHAVEVGRGGEGGATHDRKQTRRRGQDSKIWPIIYITKIIIIESPHPHPTPPFLSSCPSLRTCFCVYLVCACVLVCVFSYSIFKGDSRLWKSANQR